MKIIFEKHSNYNIGYNLKIYTNCILRINYGESYYKGICIHFKNYTLNIYYKKIKLGHL